MWQKKFAKQIQHFYLFSNLGRILRGFASADLKPSKSVDFGWPRKTSESFSWRLKLPVAKRKNSQIPSNPLGRWGLRIFR